MLSVSARARRQKKEEASVIPTGSSLVLQTDTLETFLVRELPKIPNLPTPALSYVLDNGLAPPPSEGLWLEFGVASGGTITKIAQAAIVRDAAALAAASSAAIAHAIVAPAAVARAAAARAAAARAAAARDVAARVAIARAAAAAPAATARAAAARAAAARDAVAPASVVRDAVPPANEPCPTEVKSDVPCIVHGFDSFKGLPEPWRTGFGKGAFALLTPPVVPPNVRLWPGWFEDSVPRFFRDEFPQARVAFAHIDCDLYSSTQTVLNAIGPRLLPGAVIVFDELVEYPGFEQHEIKALFEFLALSNRKFQWIGGWFGDRHPLTFNPAVSVRQRESAAHQKVAIRFL